MRAVLTTEVIPWARGAVREIDIARRLMYHAVRHRTLPKNVDDRLVTVKDPEILEYDEAELRRLHAAVTDPNFRIFTDRNTITVFNHEHLRPRHRHPGDLRAARRGRGDPRVLPGAGAGARQARHHAGQDLPPGRRVALGLPHAAGRRRRRARQADAAPASPRGDSAGQGPMSEGAPPLVDNLGETGDPIELVSALSRSPGIGVPGQRHGPSRRRCPPARPLLLSHRRSRRASSAARAGGPRSAAAVSSGAARARSAARHA